MSIAEKPTTILSTKGQVILPKAIREHRRWTPGTKLIVEETPEGVLLRAAPIFPPTRPQDVFGCLKYEGPPITDEDIEAGIMAEAKRRYARDRY